MLQPPLKSPPLPCLPAGGGGTAAAAAPAKGGRQGTAPAGALGFLPQLPSVAFGSFGLAGVPGATPSLHDEQVRKRAGALSLPKCAPWTCGGVPLRTQALHEQPVVLCLPGAVSCVCLVFPRVCEHGLATRTPQTHAWPGHIARHRHMHDCVLTCMLPSTQPWQHSPHVQSSAATSRGHIHTRAFAQCACAAPCTSPVATASILLATATT